MAEQASVVMAAPDCPRAVFLRLDILKHRADFLRVARGRRVARDGFVLQCTQRPRTGAAPCDDIRIGFTCSKKVGNAVARNRAKRRLREIARLVLPTHGHPGFDYVLIGRAQRTAQMEFETLQADLCKALGILHDSHKP